MLRGWSATPFPPLLLAEVLAREIRRQLLEPGARLGGLALIPPVRQQSPPPEPVMPLPDMYRSQIGDHPDHPGEGRLAE